MIEIIVWQVKVEGDITLEALNRDDAIAKALAFFGGNLPVLRWTTVKLPALIETHTPPP